jgi:hypothetical protein
LRAILARAIEETSRVGMPLPHLRQFHAHCALARGRTAASGRVRSSDRPGRIATTGTGAAVAARPRQTAAVRPRPGRIRSHRAHAPPIASIGGPARRIENVLVDVSFAAERVQSHPLAARRARSSLRPSPVPQVPMRHPATTTRLRNARRRPDAPPSAALVVQTALSFTSTLVRTAGRWKRDDQVQLTLALRASIRGILKRVRSTCQCP